MEVSKLKFAFYWAASCGGCEVAVLDINEKILDVAAKADIVFWPVAIDIKYKDVEALPDKHIDVCFFNGAIRTEENEKIAKLLRRSRKTIWQAYKNATKKLPAPLRPQETEYTIPASALHTPLSILEATVVYLRDQFHISYHQIGELLERNERTIWTVYHRAQKKKEDEKA